jgi:hypothetical protein
LAVIGGDRRLMGSERFMQLMTQRRFALFVALVVLAAAYWMSPPWVQGVADPDPQLTSSALADGSSAGSDPAADPAAAPAPNASNAPAPADPAAPPPADSPPASVDSPASSVVLAAANDVESAPALVALADPAPAPEASPVGGEQKMLTATTGPDSTESTDASGSGGAGLRHPSRPGARNNDPISATEWDAVAAFMAKYSPIRGGVIESLPDSPRRNTMMASAVRDYVAYKRASVDPAIATLVVSRVKMEDDIFDLARQIRQAGDTAQDALKNRLYQKVVQLVDENLKERQLWLDRLKSNLANQQAALTHETAQRDEIVQQRFADILRRAQRFNFPSLSHNSASPGATAHPADRHSTTQMSAATTKP